MFVSSPFFKWQTAAPCPLMGALALSQSSIRSLRLACAFCGLFLDESSSASRDQFSSSLWPSLLPACDYVACFAVPFWRSSARPKDFRPLIHFSPTSDLLLPSDSKLSYSTCNSFFFWLMVVLSCTRVVFSCSKVVFSCSMAVYCSCIGAVTYYSGLKSVSRRY